jgi:CAAX protease family protein
VNRSLERRQLLIFFCLAYGIAWLFFLPLGLSRAGLGWIPLNLSIPLMAVLGTLAPTLSAILTVWITEHRWPRKRLTSNPLRWAFALLISPFLIGFTYAVLPSIWLAKAPVSSLHWLALFSLSFYDPSTLIGGPLGEEPGWRGFALPRLQNLTGPWRASLLLGILWAGWHLPLFLCKSWTSSSISDFILILVGLSFLMTFLFNFSIGSVIVAILVHSSFNTTSRWMGALLNNVPLRQSPAQEFVIGVSGLAVAVVLVSLTRGRLARSGQGRSQTA